MDAGGLPDLGGRAPPSAAGPPAPVVLAVSTHSFAHSTAIHGLSQALFQALRIGPGRKEMYVLGVWVETRMNRHVLPREAVTLCGWQAGAAGQTVARLPGTQPAGFVPAAGRSETGLGTPRPRDRRVGAGCFVQGEASGGCMSARD